ncbi:MAG TPA: holo-ACP synthase [Vicinamibacteria bacterium]|nr:holo-ACP synthase [Vicinamibacteria bacterium]
MDDDVLASAVEVLEIAEVRPLLDSGTAPFTEGERAYAARCIDPERRLAARLAAKRAAARLLGGGVQASEIEVVRRPGRPPALRLGPRASDRLVQLGARRLLVSLTHGRAHAAAAVLLLRSDA